MHFLLFHSLVVTFAKSHRSFQQEHIWGSAIFLWFFLFSLHFEADQKGSTPITCQKNVPALPSFSGLT